MINPIVELSKKMGITPKQLATNTGLSTTCAYKILTKPTRRVTVRTAELVAQWLDMPVDKLFAASNTTDDGRPPLTGSAIRSHDPYKSTHGVCPACYMELLPTGNCSSGCGD